MIELLSTVLLILNVNLINGGLSPILIVPGHEGSRLEAKISDGSECDTGGKWFTYWINPDMPPKCINKVLTLKYDSNTYSNVSGVEVRVPGFGDTKTVEFLDVTKHFAYFHTFVEYFEKKGYVKGETIRAAPYDWRLAADNLEKKAYYESVKGLIEKMYDTSKNKVSIVVHSMGGPVTLYFLNNIVSQDWKDKYVNAFIPLSGGWAGGNILLLIFISATGGTGYEKQFDISVQTMESIAWMEPNPLVWKNKTIITTSTRNYSAYEYEELFDLIDRKTDFDKIKQSLPLNGDYPAPNVPVHCFYGVGVPTVEVINYGSTLPKNYESLTFGDGDSVVNLQSSEVCKRWSNQKAPFHLKLFQNTTHAEMVTSLSVLEAVAEAICGIFNDELTENNQ